MSQAQTEPTFKQNRWGGGQNSDSPASTLKPSESALLRNVVKDYPYRNSRERDSVTLVLRKDFSFESSYRLFAQVINNLLKNAFRSLAAVSSAPKPGDLRIEVGVLNGAGRIVVTDQGVGIPPELQARIFEPFFSTDHGTGHGLGLAFCQQVVQGAGGTIRVKSEPGRGAIFIIELAPVHEGLFRP